MRIPSLRPASSNSKIPAQNKVKTGDVVQWYNTPGFSPQYHKKLGRKVLAVHIQKHIRNIYPNQVGFIPGM